MVVQEQYLNEIRTTGGKHLNKCRCLHLISLDGGGRLGHKGLHKLMMLHTHLYTRGFARSPGAHACGWSLLLLLQVKLWVQPPA